MMLEHIKSHISFACILLLTWQPFSLVIYSLFQCRSRLTTVGLGQTDTKTCKSNGLSFKKKDLEYINHAPKSNILFKMKEIRNTLAQVFLLDSYGLVTYLTR